MVEIYEMTPVTCFADQVYGSSVNSPVRHKCLSVIGKLMYFSSADMIQSLNNITNISRYEYQQNICLKFFIRCGSWGRMVYPWNNLLCASYFFGGEISSAFVISL